MDFGHVELFTVQTSIKRFPCKPCTLGSHTLGRVEDMGSARLQDGGPAEDTERGKLLRHPFGCVSLAKAAHCSFSAGPESRALSSASQIRETRRPLNPLRRIW